MLLSQPRAAVQRPSLSKLRCARASPVCSALHQGAQTTAGRAALHVLPRLAARLGRTRRRTRSAACGTASPVRWLARAWRSLTRIR